MQTVLGNRVAPWFLDRYLARTGIDGQQTDRSSHPDPADNLWEPRDEHEDRGAHGAFDDTSSERDPVSALARAWETGCKGVARVARAGSLPLRRGLTAAGSRAGVNRPGY